MNNEEKILQLLGQIVTDVSGLKEDVSGLKEDVSGLKEGQARLETKVDGLESRLDNLESDVSDVRRTVTRIENVHGEKIMAIFDKCDVLDNKIDRNGEKLDRIENEVMTHDFVLRKVVNEK